MPVCHPMAASGCDGPFHSSDYVVDLLVDGAAGAERVIRESGPKLRRDDYVALRRRLDRSETFTGT
jgi:hypothetical protein